MKVYLAGPMAGLTFNEASGWRDRLARAIRVAGGSVFSPTEWEQQAIAGHEAEVLIPTGPMYGPKIPSSEFFARDLFGIRQADIVFVNFLGAKNWSIGTTCELAWAYLLGKYTIVVLDQAHEHPFIRQQASMVFTNLDTAENYLADFLKLIT